MTCFDIPERLHTNSKPADEHFKSDEKLFRRFSQTEQNKPAIKDGKLTHAAFSLKEMSVNRQKHSEKPEDVLYNIKTGEHFWKYGIYALCVGDIQVLSYLHPTEQNRIYVLRVAHEPEPCMYPHSVIAVLENDARISDIKPSSVKTKLRDDFIERATILKMPTD